MTKEIKDRPYFQMHAYSIKLGSSKPQQRFDCSAQKMISN